MNLSRLLMLLALALSTTRIAGAQALSENQFVIIPLRVHILTAPDIEAANCTLSDADLARVLGHVNAIWHKAGVHFGVESVLREPADQQERFRITTESSGGEPSMAELQILLPRSSRSFDGLHVYYFHELPFNSAFVGDDTVFANEAAKVQQVRGGGDDPVARVTAHALGNALGLPNHSDERNLMGNATSGVALNASQGETARLVAKTIRGATTVSGLRTATEAAEARQDNAAARRLRTWLSEVSEAVAVAAEEAKAKAASAPKRERDHILIVPLRVHVLTAPDMEIANCNLSDADITRVIGDINAIWHKAGIHFGVESVLHEPVEQRERFRVVTELSGGEPSDTELRLLLPRSSRAFDGLHVYYFHQLDYNSAYVGDDIVFAQESPKLRQVKGGGDDPVARVTAHALGNLLGLSNEGEPRNLMGNATTGIDLDDTQAETASKVARTIRGVATVPELQKAAEAAESRGDRSAGRRLWSWLAEIPGPGAAEAERRRESLAPSR
jgi:hypothetical protein